MHHPSSARFLFPTYTTPCAEPLDSNSIFASTLLNVITSAFSPNEHPASWRLLQWTAFSCLFVPNSAPPTCRRTWQFNSDASFRHSLSTMLALDHLLCSRFSTTSSVAQTQSRNFSTSMTAPFRHYLHPKSSCTSTSAHSEHLR
jgi:hypothetical protein